MQKSFSQPSNIPIKKNQTTLTFEKPNRYTLTDHQPKRHNEENSTATATTGGCEIKSCVDKIIIFFNTLLHICFLSKRFICSK